MRRKERRIVCISLAAAMLLTGCQKSPENSIVTNKDFDHMVSQAENAETGTSDVAEMAVTYDKYQNTISDESLGVTLNVDAKVDIPQTDKMSIIRVRQKEISQEFLDKVRNALMPGLTLYDGSVLNTPTKSSIEEEIRMWKRELESVEAQFAAGEYDQETLESYREEYQGGIDRLKEQYENAPDEITLKDYPSDGQLHTVAELLAQNPDSDYYSWQNDLNKSGSIFYGVSKGEDGRYHSLYAQNNENYGNCIRYKMGRKDYPWISSVSVSSPLERGGYEGNVWKASEEPQLSVEAEWNEMREVGEESASISQEDARALADGLMEELGLTEYGCYSGDLYHQYCDVKDGVLEYNRVYIFQYLRNIDGVFVNNEGLGKFVDEWKGDEYVKKEWAGESVVIYVNDSGIQSFQYLAPMEQTETVVDKASMKTFDEIKGIFEQMAVVTNASQAEKVTIDVDRVSLRYTRISEADSFNTGLLVPVWDFEGTITTEFRGASARQIILTINAIDGSVIDKQLGY